MHQQAASQQMIEQIQQLIEAEQLRYFGTVLSAEHEATLASFALKRLRKKYRSVTIAIQEHKWLSEWALFQTMYQAYQHKAYQRTAAVYSADEVTALLWVKHLLIEDLSHRN